MKINVFIYKTLFPKTLFWHVESQCDNSVEQIGPNGHRFCPSSDNDKKMFFQRETSTGKSPFGIVDNTVDN